MKQATKAKIPFPIRVVMSSLPVALIILPILWIVGYPSEEWPFVSGVFALSLVGSGTLIGSISLLAVTRLHNYACSVALKWGIDVDETENLPDSSKRVRVISAIVAALLVSMATWGLALYTLALVMGQMAMDPLGSQFSTVALSLLVVGAAGFSLIIIVLSWFFYTADRDPQSLHRFSRQFRSWMNIAGYIGNRRGISGVPSLTGSNPFG